MRLWLDAQLPPSLAAWLGASLGLEAVAVRDIGLRDASDEQIFRAAREADAVVMTKDADFVTLLEQHGPPPRVVLVTCGNTSNARLREVVTSTWRDVSSLLAAGEPLVELGDRPSRTR